MSCLFPSTKRPVPSFTTASKVVPLSEAPSLTSMTSMTSTAADSGLVNPLTDTLPGKQPSTGSTPVVDQCRVTAVSSGAAMPESSSSSSSVEESGNSDNSSLSKRRVQEGKDF